MPEQSRTKRISTAVAPTAKIPVAPDFLQGGGTMGTELRAINWSQHTLGRPDTWPNSLQLAVNLILNSAIPMFIWWDKEHLTNIYNDAFRVILGDKHKNALGKSAPDVWDEVWEEVGPLARRVITTGEPFYVKNLELQIDRFGYTEQVYFTFSFSPVQAHGKVGGVLCVVTETTNEVLYKRELEQNQAKLEGVLHSVTDGIGVYDMNGTLTLLNDALADSNGFKNPKEMKRNLDSYSKYFRLLDGNGIEIPVAQWPLSRVLRGESFKELEIRTQRIDTGQEWCFSYTGSPIYDAAGTQIRAVLVTRDVTEKKQAEEELRESELRFRNIADTAPMFIAMADEHGNATYFNKPWLDFTGKDMDGMAGMGWLSTLHPNDASVFEADFKKAFSKQKSLHEQYRFRRSDGEYRWMLAVGAPRYTPEGSFIGYYGTYTDIHDLKTAQLDIQSSEERFRTLIKESSDAIQLVSPDGRIMFSSDSVEKVLGYKPAELQDKTLAPFIHPDDWDAFMKQWKILLKKHRNQIRIEYRVKHKNGSWAWLETTGTNHLKTPHVEALVGNFRNITARKNADEALKIQSHLLETITHNATLGLVMMDENQRCTFMNQAAEQIVGYRLQDIQSRGQPLHNIIHHTRPDGSHYPMTECPIDRALPRQSRTKGEDIFVRPDGSFYPVAFTASPIIQNGKPVGTVIELRDTTNEKAANKEHERLLSVEHQRNELIKLNQAKDEFISIASHQLRTPATGVKQFIGMLLEGYAGDIAQSQRKFLETAYESNERQLTIVNDLLKVARVDSGKLQIRPEKVDIVQTIQEIIHEQSQKFAASKQKVIFKHTQPKIIVTADVLLLRTALENLIDNAHKYTFPGKKITITAAMKQGVRVDIQDQGTGIAEEDMDKLFQKFSRIDNPLSATVGGTGLGLYWVKRVIDLHSGNIGVTSQINKGTTFTITLPETKLK